MKDFNPQKRIRMIMKNKNFTQKELSEILGISQPAISLYLKGRMPPADILYRIAQIAETSVEWLLTGTESKKVYSVHERKALYGNQYILLDLWKKIPSNIQRDLLNLIRHILIVSSPGKLK